jgi:hypothetical protein
MSTGKKRLLAYIIMVVSFLASVKLVKDIVKLWHVDERLIEAEGELLMVKEEQDKLEKQLERVEADDWREAQVRDTLKMARQDEAVVVVPGELLSFESAEKKESIEGREGDLTNIERWRRVFAY